MAKLEKKDIKQEVFDLYDDYAHNKLNRRQFIEKLSIYAVGGITLPSLLSFMSPNYTDSILVESDNPSIDSKTINYNSPKGGGDISGLLSMPKNKTKKRSHILM